MITTISLTVNCDGEDCKASETMEIVQDPAFWNELTVDQTLDLYGWTAIAANEHLCPSCAGTDT